LWGQYQLSSDNSEAVAYYQDNNWWLIGLSLVTLVLIPIVSKEKLTRYLFLLLLLPFFATWKHAMARGEEHHIGGFLNFMLLFLFLLWILVNEKNILITVLGILSVSLFLSNLTLNKDYSSTGILNYLKSIIYSTLLMITIHCRNAREPKYS